MSSLFELKKKGRVLRKHLELIFGTEVALSQAYEALAAMDGKSDWNTLVASVHARPDQGTSEFIQRNAQSLVIVPHWAEFVSWTKDAGYDESYLDINDSKCLALQEQYLQELNKMPKDEPQKFHADTATTLGWFNLGNGVTPQGNLVLTVRHRM